MKVASLYRNAWKVNHQLELCHNHSNYRSNASRKHIWPGTVEISFRCRTAFPSHKNKQGKNYSVNGNWSFAITLILYLAPALIIPQSLLRQKIWFETKEAFVSNEGSFSRMTLSCLFFSSITIK